MTAAGFKAAARSFSCIVLAALLFGGGNLLAQRRTPQVAAQPNITASQTDAFPAHADGRAREGETIDYTTVISNATGTADATGVLLTVPTPGNTTDTGTITVSPLAFPDPYLGGKNTPLVVSDVTKGVLANDKGLPAPTVSGIVGCADVTTPFDNCATTQGGTVSLADTGTFTYTPPNAAFTGTDTFDYTVTNSNSPDDSATVTITVVPPPVAVDDGYNANKDATLVVPAASGVLFNDTVNSATIVSYGTPNGNEDSNIGTPTPTSAGGSVTLSADGSRLHARDEFRG